MGMGIMRASKCKCPEQTPVTPSAKPSPPVAPRSNPNPRNFTVLRSYGAGKWTVVEVRYPDATNYEGRKVMVYRSPVVDVLRQTSLDPHFCDNGSCLSPFARFEPTELGWQTAVALANSMNR